MNATILNETFAAQWNAFVNKEPTFSLMQSWEWGQVKQQLGWEAFRVAVMDEEHFVAGAQILVKRLPLGMASLAYVPRGPVGDWKQPEIACLLFEKIHQVCRKNRSIFLKMEPAVASDPEIQSLFANLGFHTGAVNNQPAATIIMDISLDEERILRSMRDSTRRKIPSTEKKGVSVRRGTLDDLPTFYRFMQLTARRTGFTLRDFDYYETEFRTFSQLGGAALFLAEYQGEVLATHIAYAFGGHAAFFHQASDTESTNLNPNCLLVWEQIKWAKSLGCTTLDLWGIPDEIADYHAKGQDPDPDRTDGLWGVYRFKSGFSKNVVCYLGAMDYAYWPWLYRLLTNKILSQPNLERISSWTDRHLYHRMERSHGVG